MQITLTDEDISKIKGAIINMHPCYPRWSDKETLVENIVRCCQEEEDYVSENYIYDDPYSISYSIGDSYCPTCDGS